MAGSISDAINGNYNSGSIADAIDDYVFNDIDEINQSVNSNITTYGAILLPFDRDEVLKPKVNPKKETNFIGKLKSALNLSSDRTLLQALGENPTQLFKDTAKFMLDEREFISGKMNEIASKYSGIAVAQALVNGNVSAREALDYLFMGFAPALGIQGSLMGYSGLTQLKDALFNGTINVGQFIGGFTKVLKGGIELKDFLKNKETQTGANVLEFDLTISHSESYQSETPDRRVQNGQTLNEYVHNMPVTFDVQCALQEGKRYSKAEFRTILTNLRERKETVSLVLGDEIFDDLILTNFNPTHDCTKSGMDYSLSFKKITRSDVDTQTEVIVQTAPQLVKNTDTDINSNLGSIGKISGSGGISGISEKMGDFDIKAPVFDNNAISQEMNLPTNTMNGSMLYGMGGSMPYESDEAKLLRWGGKIRRKTKPGF